ncbi:MAG: hypothetical protein J6J71_04630 [Prevotella sp.]|nr:hypothetical protein [Prevotella sp.]
MCEYTTLTSYREALEAEKVALENADIEALTEEKLAEVRSKIREEIVADIEHKKFVADVKIGAIADAIEIVERNIAEEQEEVTDEVPTETISDESY